MGKDNKCICGSGRDFEFCCKPFINRTIEDYKKALKQHNQIEAYYIAIGILSNYLIKVERDTNRALKISPKTGAFLLQCDIEALSEGIERILKSVQGGRLEDWGMRLENIKSLVDSTAWKERCTYYQLIFYMLFPDKYEKELKGIVTSLKLYKEMDYRLLSCVYSLIPKGESLSLSLKVADWLIEKTDEPFMRIKYKFDKAVDLALYQDNKAGKHIADEVIKELDNYRFDSQNIYELNQSAMIYEFYVQFVGDNSWYQKSLEIRSMIDVDAYTVSGKAMHYRQLGYTYWCMKEYEKANDNFEKSLEYEPNNFSKIYQLHCLINLKRITSLDDFMETVEFDALGVDTIDFIIIIGSAAIELDDIKNIAVINNYIKNMDFTGVPYFDVVLKDLQIEIEKKSGGLKMLLQKLRPFTKYFMFQPNYCGVGINIDKIREDMKK